MSLSDQFGYEHSGAYARPPKDARTTPVVGDLIYSTGLPSGGGKVIAVKPTKNQFGEDIFEFKIRWTDGTTTTDTTDFRATSALFDRMIAAKEAQLARLLRARDKASLV